MKQRNIRAHSQHKTSPTRSPKTAARELFIPCFEGKHLPSNVRFSKVLPSVWLELNFVPQLMFKGEATRDRIRNRALHSMNDMQTNPKKETTRMTAKTKLTFFLLALLTIVPVASNASAEDSQSQTNSAELAKKTQNPVADIISIPFENYFYFNAGPNHATLYDLNVKPVIPFHLNENWNLITRTIIPIINEPSLSPGSRSAFGLGDINPTFFLSPAKSSGFIWGAGPTFTLPTAMDSLLGSGKFSMGPSAVALVNRGPWLFGALAYNQWSVTGWGKANVNDMLIEPFANYNFGKGWHLSTAPLITANWEAAGSQQWTVPVGGGIGKLVWFGKLPADILVQGYSNVKHPQNTPDWELRFQITFLLPGFKKSSK